MKRPLPAVRSERLPVFVHSGTGGPLAFYLEAAVMRHAIGVDAMEFIGGGAGPLLRVRAERAGRWWARLDFVFGGGSLQLLTQPDTDEIVAQVISPEDTGAEDVSDDVSFAPLIGKHVEYAWQMVNHRGYRDAFQLRFIDLQDRTEATRQFEVGAAAISVTNVI